MKTHTSFFVTLFVLSSFTAASSNELYKGLYGDGNNTIFQFLDGTYLIYCRDGAPENSAWKCRRRRYEKTDKGFVIQFNPKVPRKDSLVLEINKVGDGYQLVYKNPRRSKDYWSYADTKPVKLKFKNAKYSGDFGNGKKSSVSFKNGRLTFCFKKKCSKHKVKSFGVTIRTTFRNGVKFYLTPVSDTEVIGTYMQSDGQYTAHYKIAQ